LLLLDDDTVLMGSVYGDCGISEVRYGIFSGALIKADVVASMI